MNILVPCSFSRSALTPRYTILDSMFPPCNAISEGRLPLCSTSSEAGALLSEVRIENDSDRKFSKSIFFQKFSGNHFYPRFMVRCSLLAENIFSVFRSPHLPLDTPFWTRGFPLVMQSRKVGFPFATRARKREPCLHRYVSRMTRTENFLENTFLHVLWYLVHY